MKKNTFILPFVLPLFLLPSCQKDPISSESTDSIPVVRDTAITIGDSVFDSAPDSAVGLRQNLPQNHVLINLSEGASVTSDASKVEIDNENNVIHIKEIGDYVVSGSLDSGVILNEAPSLESGDTVKILMNGVYLRSEGSYSFNVDGKNIVPGPIYSIGTSNLLLNVPEDTASVIVDGRLGDAVVRQNDAGIYAYSKIKIRGKGSLRVNTFCNNGIESRKGIDANSLTLTVVAAGSCLKATNSIVLGREDEEGSFNFISTGEAGHAVEVTSLDTSVTIPVLGNAEENDEIAGIALKDASYFMNVPGSAIDSKGYLYMEGGNGRIESKNSHAIVADKDLFIDGGSFYLRAPKGDGIRSRGSSVLINDGAYSMDVGSTNMCQGIRAETIMDIRGGYINVNSGYRGFLAQKITTSGGTTSVTTIDDGWKADTLNRNRLETLVDISGGNHFINAGGDGIDSESRLEMRRGLMIIASTEDEAHSPLESGENNPILVSGGTLIAYGSSGQVFSLNGTQNTVVVKKHHSLEANKYYVVRAGSNYYAVKTTKESSSISVSSSDFASNDYAIMTASSIVYDTPIWESAGFYRIRSFTFLSLICSGTYSSSTNQHPEYYENPWNVPSGWRHFGF
ncbi:MAG: carbohydrate-binding domain-containing protein [Bacilli bacterium]|nr:carbohydrate-binding domain-containing protein [Bacilli bacterium]